MADETSRKAMQLRPGLFLMLVVKCERKVVSRERNCKGKRSHHSLILEIVNQRRLQKMLTFYRSRAVRVVCFAGGPFTEVETLGR